MRVPQIINVMISDREGHKFRTPEWSLRHYDLLRCSIFQLSIWTNEAINPFGSKKKKKKIIIIKEDPPDPPHPPHPLSWNKETCNIFGLSVLRDATTFSHFVCSFLCPIQPFT